MKRSLIGCSSDSWGGVCRHEVVFQGATEPVSVSRNEAVLFDVQGNGEGIRVIVESSSRDARVVFQLIDTSTGEVQWATSGNGLSLDVGDN